MGLTKNVDFVTAKLLKEKKFDIRTKGFYNNGIYVNTGSEIGQYHSFHNGEPKTDNPLIALAPTIADAVMWLYEKHGIWIECLHRGDMGDFTYKVSKLKNNWRTEPHYIYENGFNSPTEAYLEAINHTLKNLI